MERVDQTGGGKFSQAVRPPEDVVADLSQQGHVYLDTPTHLQPGWGKRTLEGMIKFKVFLLICLGKINRSMMFCTITNMSIKEFHP